MSDMYRNFKSQAELNSIREENKNARQLILDNAKRKFQINEAKKERARRQGEGTWMLDSVSHRIATDEQKFLKTKKKKKKKRKREISSPGTGSVSDSEEEEKELVEAPANLELTSSGTVKGPQRESWMEAPLDLIPTTSRQDIRAAINKSKLETKRAAEKMLEPGQHSRELNPYWKDGGIGLPEKRKPSAQGVLPSSSAGDGGFSWLQKAYSRCVQQAADEARDLEDVAAERYGSLSNLEKMLAEAKQKMLASTQEASYQPRAAGDVTDSRRKRSDSRERKMQRIWGQEEAIRGSAEFKSRCFDDDGDSGRRNIGFVRPSESNNQPNEKGGTGLLLQDPKRNMKPKENARNKNYQTSESYKPRWKKNNEEEKMRERNRKPCSGLKPRKEDDEKTGGSTENFHQKEDKYYIRDPKGLHWKENQDKTQKIHEKRKNSSSDSSSASNNGSDLQDSEDEDESGSLAGDKPKMLSEEELNELAAKVLRAEIMGDDDTAAELKSKLEAARQQQSLCKSGMASGGPTFSYQRCPVVRKQDHNMREADGGEENVVVLSRTSKGGMVRPVLGSAVEYSSRKSGRKKRKMASTHDIAGERTIYFEDDNKFDLQALVEQEKAGTAEDQNSMFSRLAGRSDDRDLDIDDMFVSKAARRQEEDRAAIHDKAAAIFEHRKISSAMEKCARCFDKVPKHLIIAIGSKSYLCVPPHRSLTEGHCFIVPMQHVSSCTAIDEDVWREMQLFRKSLVQMFLSQDEDLVIMETVMHLKHFPHTALECIPLEKETGDLGPIYFKKAILEAGPEWADNKKLHSLKEKDVQHVIPKGFPYFSVDFGLQGGYATIIEDEQTFPSYFGREIVGGMIDAEPGLWRKPHKQSFEDQRQKVLKFEKMWRPFDWTQNLDAAD
ncbi:hypothetical protein RRG08_009578 [Elysia crispata]|uniref:CWF19-like protein 2 n=1 Tax=Elysia crispata TaxID=231223 RepID=A0AAE0XED2_9GAST|nr:hypothetical protein RRG08_009578 [Elysia crispata]